MLMTIVMHYSCNELFWISLLITKNDLMKNDLMKNNHEE